MDEITELLDYFVENLPLIWRFWRAVVEKIAWDFSNDRKIPTDLFTKFISEKKSVKSRKKVEFEIDFFFDFCQILVLPSESASNMDNRKLYIRNFRQMLKVVLNL